MPSVKYSVSVAEPAATNGKTATESIAGPDVRSSRHAVRAASAMTTVITASATTCRPRDPRTARVATAAVAARTVAGAAVVGAMAWSTATGAVGPAVAPAAII